MMTKNQSTDNSIDKKGSSKSKVYRGLRFICILLGFVGIYSLYGFAIDPLPPKFRIYVNAKGIVLTRPAMGYCPTCIRVANIFYKTPGCYITCHTTNPDKAVYAVSPNVFVTGMIRVEGNYEGKICRPRDYEKATLRNEPIFQELCSKTYSCIGNSCWAEGDTGDLFGLKP